MIIQKAGDEQSRVLNARAGFSLTVSVTSGTMSSGWRLYYSDDGGTTWKPAQDNDFSSTYTDEIYPDIPQGYKWQVRGGTGANLRVSAAYLAYAEPMSISIDRDVE